VIEPLTGYLMLCERLYSSGSEYDGGWNFGADINDAKNVEWIVRRICELWSNDAVYEVDNTVQPHEANYLKLDCTKAKTLLGWNSIWDVETTLEMVVDWYKCYQKNDDMRNACVNQIEQYFTINK
jgi:CDP-glucose 4,6-dehydratase